MTSGRNMRPKTGMGEMRKNLLEMQSNCVLCLERPTGIGCVDMGSSCLACDLKPSKHTFMEETFSGSQFKRIQFTMPGKVWWWEAVELDHIWAGQEAGKRGMFK